MRTLRPYQQTAVTTTLTAVANGDTRLWYQLPTGSGKTVVASKLIQELSQNFDLIIFMVHRQDLVRQTASDFGEFLDGLSTGIVMGKQNECDHDVTVASVQTLDRGKRLQTLMENHERCLLFIDECHHVAPTGAYARVIASLDQTLDLVVIGCTATPYRSDNKPGLESVLTKCTCVKTIEELQEERYLAQTVWSPQYIEANLSDCETSTLDGQPDYADEAVAQILFPSMHQIAQKTIATVGDRSTVVFVPTVKFAQELADEFNRQLLGIKPGEIPVLAGLQQNRAYAVWSEGQALTDRQWILEEWKKGQLVQFVVNVGILTEGFDFPDLSACVLATATMSPAKYLQMVGRVTRIKSQHNPHKDALIIDLVGNANLLETPQIVLPKVLEAVSEQHEFIMSNPKVLNDPEFQIEQMKVAGNPASKGTQERSYKILDPLSKSWISWGHQKGLYYASLGNESIAVIKRVSDSGLWNGYIITPKEDKIHWNRYAVNKAGATTLNTLMQHINHIIANNGVKRLIDKNANWMKLPASVKAVNMLSYLDGYAGKLARQYKWSGAQVNQAIAYAKIHALLKFL